MKISSSKKAASSAATITLLGSSNSKGRTKSTIDSKTSALLAQRFAGKQHLVSIINEYGEKLFVNLAGPEKEVQAYEALESARKLGHSAYEHFNKGLITEVGIVAENLDASEASAFLEGFLLSSYRFECHQKTDKKRKHIAKVLVEPNLLSTNQTNRIWSIVQATFAARDLVNEPPNVLTAPQFAKEIKRLSRQFGFKASSLGINKIQSLKMGGLLAVNAGSELPPSFNIMEWNPPKAKNKKPIVLVGKGVVYDTGGINLKVGTSSVEFMKADMAGAASVVGAFCAIAALNLPLHIIGLVPSTDNKTGADAYVPGDIITISDGTTVEVLNTDAEGRLILADALVYAKKYNPELVIDLATLTGAAARALGPVGTVYMSNADDKHNQALETSGEATYERLVRFPLWTEFGDQLKSPVADLKNIGGAFAGAITAGKFLEHFTDYPWMHLDIAGPSFLTAKSSYHLQGGTGVGVRLLTHFLENYSS